MYQISHLWTKILMLRRKKNLHKTTVNELGKMKTLLSNFKLFLKRNNRFDNIFKSGLFTEIIII